MGTRALDGHLDTFDYLPLPGTTSLTDWRVPYVRRNKGKTSEYCVHPSGTLFIVQIYDRSLINEILNYE